MSNLNLGLDIDREIDPPESIDIGGDEPTRSNPDYVLSQQDIIILISALTDSTDLRAKSLRERLYFASGVVIETDA